MIDRVILDLCSGTGSWSEPYFKAGYKVIRVTLPEKNIFTWIPPRTAWGILAAPMCNDFSKMNPKRNPERGFIMVRRCMEIIWQCRPHFWALENPRGDLAKFLGYPAYSFDPCDFGYSYSKRTWLWGYFKRPQKPEPKMLKFAKKYEEMSMSEFREQGLIGRNRSELRACTPPMFADAFFKMNP